MLLLHMVVYAQWSVHYPVQSCGQCGQYGLVGIWVLGVLGWFGDSEHVELSVCGRYVVGMWLVKAVCMWSVNQINLFTITGWFTANVSATGSESCHWFAINFFTICGCGE